MLFLAILFTVFSFIGLYIFLFGGVALAGLVISQAEGWMSVTIGIAIALVGICLEVLVVWAAVINWLSYFATT